MKAAEVIFAETNADNGESTSESSHSSNKINNINNDNDKNEESGKESADGKSQIYLAIFVIMKYKSQNHLQCLFLLLTKPFSGKPRGGFPYKCRSRHHHPSTNLVV